MRKFYNGYAFCYECARKKGLLYNPTLVLYFLKHFQTRGAAPRRMLDSNLAPDSAKKVFDNPSTSSGHRRDYRWTNELTVKTAFLSLLFEDTFYIMESETALARRYADLTMIIRPDMRRFQLLDILIEFKYVSLDDAGISGEAARQSSLADLKALTPVKNKLADAKTSLQTYRRTLETRHGNVLRLRVYSVVAVGFERLVWEELT